MEQKINDNSIGEQNYLSKEEKESHCREVIKDAVVFKEESFFINSQSHKTALEIMTAMLSEQLYRLLDDGTRDHQDWGHAIYNFKSLLQELLVLLGKPGVLKQLPEYYQKNTSERINKLIDFFYFIDDEKLHALMDLKMLDFSPADKIITRLINYYTFDKKQLNQRHCSSYLLFDYHFHKNHFDNMERLAEQKNGGSK